MDNTTTLSTEQYLTFTLENEVFAFEIAKIREVLEYVQITKVPQAPEMMLGVINLRGSVVPVIDLRSKFKMGVFEQSINTCIIITEIVLDDESTLIGALVDSVREVMDLNTDEVEPPPKIGSQINTDFIKGMGKLDDQFVIILNIDMIFNSDELVVIRDTVEEGLYQ